MEKGFKKDFAGADELMPALFQLFRRRINKAGNPAAKAQVKEMGMGVQGRMSWCCCSLTLPRMSECCHL